MYERLSQISDGIKWIGCASAFEIQEYIDFGKGGFSAGYQENYWVSDVIERLGLPFYFSDGEAKATFIEGKIVNDMSDERIREVFKGSVFCDGESAAALVNRGFGDLLGIEVSDWDIGTITAETFDEYGIKTCTKQNNARKITVTCEKVEILSYNYLRSDDKPKLLAPAVTKLDRGKGKCTVVFCGSPHAAFNYMEGFAFLNETRKKQLIALLSEAGALPIYMPYDDEICLRAGYLPDGVLVAEITDIGIDPVEKLRLYLENKPQTISHMQPDGFSKEVAFDKIGDGIYEIDVRVEPMYPVILFIK